MTTMRKEMQVSEGLVIPLERSMMFMMWQCWWCSYIWMVMMAMEWAEKGILRIINTPDSFGGTAVRRSRLGCGKGHPPHQDQPLQSKHSPIWEMLSWAILCGNWEFWVFWKIITFPSASPGRSEEGVGISSARQVLHLLGRDLIFMA